MAHKNPEPVKAQKAALMPSGVFGSLEFRTNATAGLAEWRSFQKRSQSERELYARCASSEAKCPEHLRTWGVELRGWQALSKLRQINAVNSWINARIRYTEDFDIFGVADRWLTLLYAMRGRGDCEDYALAKYETLRSLGFSENSLRLVVVKDTRKQIGHAVLTVTVDGDRYVLDNQIRRAVRHETISHYAPVFSVNASGRWINIATRRKATNYEVALKRNQGQATASLVERHVASRVDDSLASLKPIISPDSSIAPAARGIDSPQLGSAYRELP